MTSRLMTPRRRPGSGSISRRTTHTLRALGFALGSMFGLRTAAAQIITLEEIEMRAQRDRAELSVPRASIARAKAQLALVESRSGPIIGARAEGAIAPGSSTVQVLDEGTGAPYLVQGSKTFTDPEAFIPGVRYGGVFSGRMTLLDFGRTELATRAAQAAIGAEQANLTRTKVELVKQARVAYLLWVEAHQTWQLAERDADVAAARTVSVRELIDEGARPATDATLSAYDEQIARLRQNRAARAAEAALEALGDVVQSELPAHAVPDLEVLEPDAESIDADSEAAPPGGEQGNAPTGSPVPGSPATAGPARSGALSVPAQARSAGSTGADSTLNAIELSRQAALSAARAAERGRAPVLDASMEAGIQGQNASVFPIYRASVALSVPIYDGGAQAAEAAVHRAEAEGLDAQRRVRQHTLVREDAANRRRWHAATTSLRLSLDLLKVAEQLLTEAEDHYRSGSDTLERVLSAQRSLVQARREVLTARVETASARLDLAPVRLQ